MYSPIRLDTSRKKCKHKNNIPFKNKADHSWILFYECQDCWVYSNRFTQKEFDDFVQIEEKWKLYQFKNWLLVWWGRYIAKWLSLSEDLRLPQNLLWADRWKYDRRRTYKPLKLLNNDELRLVTQDMHVPAIYRSTAKLLIFNRVKFKALYKMISDSWFRKKFNEDEFLKEEYNPEEVYE